jgi:hypothetical protein
LGDIVAIRPLCVNTAVVQPEADHFLLAIGLAGYLKLPWCKQFGHACTCVRDPANKGAEMLANIVAILMLSTLGLS